MKRIKFWIRNYFGFSKKETNGFIIIMVLMIVSVTSVLVYPWVASKFFAHKQMENLDQHTLDSLEALIEKQTAELAAEKEVLKNEYEAKKPTTNYRPKKKFVKEQIGRASCRERV